MDNKIILRKFIPIADMIVATFGKNCEAVIHDLTNVQSSLFYIKGTVTGRKHGAPTTEVVLRELRKYGDEVPDKLGFTSRTKDFRTLRSSISFIRNETGKVIGFFGINYDITAFSNVCEVLSEFSAAQYLGQPSPVTDESYAENIEEIFETLIKNTLMEIGVPIEEMGKREKMYFVQRLDEKGSFLIQGSVERIADILGVSKQTIYNYLEQSRAEG
ncbi:helix-turn-helix transcriptional regulator [Shouchella clausii]|uniref:Transcriptional regulator n=1 Tax=Shouchella clausii TaxID=79880 RepID=A0A268S6G0_SHOCL|nr:helix-turn-helix transcriptional regulator [Shouchella clausii]SPT77666.1 transcriptional regulator [Niallia circulans]AST94513.1 transcriptional regulator [Shouchella clausii]MCM3548292.1 helix-turn-helix transcriptional regulator [Shouchella clausii]MCR1290149.1 helix-turn-helix transcriptional regulator [Shouchella clausii]MEB5473024.1 helix-turn-helix transcriptional regulator [Shouchella clausii]